MHSALPCLIATVVADNNASASDIGTADLDAAASVVAANISGSGNAIASAAEDNSSAAGCSVGAFTDPGNSSTACNAGMTSPFASGTSIFCNPKPTDGTVITTDAVCRSNLGVARTSPEACGLPPVGGDGRNGASVPAVRECPCM